MARKPPESASIPLPVLALLERWGKLIKMHRIKRKIRLLDMQARLGVSQITLQRMEKGLPNVQVGTYMNALLILGLLDELCPTPEMPDTDNALRQRARIPGEKNDDYF